MATIVPALSRAIADLFTSRATFAPLEWLARAAPCLRPHDHVLVMAAREDLPREYPAIAPHGYHGAGSETRVLHEVARREATLPDDAGFRRVALYTLVP